MCPVMDYCRASHHEAHEVAFLEQPAVAGAEKTVPKNDRAVERATTVFTEYEPFIRGVIHNQAEGKLDSEDLFQEFYLALVRNPIPEDVRDVRGYLYRAIRNHVISTIRFRETYSHLMKKYAREFRILINNQQARSASMDDERTKAEIDRLARHLPKREAQAFLLKFRDHCNLWEIAARMGVNRRTVSRYLSHSLRKLCRRLATE